MIQAVSRIDKYSLSTLPFYPLPKIARPRPLLCRSYNINLLLHTFSTTSSMTEWKHSTCRRILISLSSPRRNMIWRNISTFTFQYLRISHTHTSYHSTAFYAVNYSYFFKRLFPQWSLYFSLCHFQIISLIGSIFVFWHSNNLPVEYVPYIPSMLIIKQK